MNRSLQAITIFAILTAVGIWPATSAEPAALVEEVTGTQAGVEVMDYLPVGRRIDLAKTERLVIEYLRSCWRETILGGSVTIGADQSAVSGGTVRREKLECDGGKMHLSPDQAAKAAEVVFRELPNSAGGPVVVERTIYALSPIIELGGSGKLVVERLDKANAPLVLNIEPQQLVHGTFFDFAPNGYLLDAGGLYRASFEGRTLVFQLATNAKLEVSAPITRLLKL